jgi:hypothetical protein
LSVEDTSAVQTSPNHPREGRGLAGRRCDHFHFRDSQTAVNQIRADSMLVSGVRAMKATGERTRQRSRDGKILIAGYFHPDFRRSIRLLQAETDETLEALLTRALNKVFREHGVPVVDRVTGAEDRTTQETTPAA